ncbi:hypothetical protein [Sphingomonas sp. CFBP 13720]|uniref:hypothetical protein n=1 Tax=Sphingomonas sp. CFBP 13720 TaxID=2775302 RepID=UPI001781A32D|nr:hypothetical protein [Sphingomonas sp. CFBP 13720]MBD8677555.1 hypothetical protein [Sphingomonas sp. CFBP 13720]
MPDLMTPPTPLVADTTGSSETFHKLRSYDIDPEDQELATSISHFDPHATPSPIEIEGDFRAPARLTARALPDAMRREVELKIVGMPAGESRDQKEHEFTVAALRQNSLGVRVRLGLGAGANQYQRETFALQRDLEKVEADAAEIMNSLNEVVRLDVTGVDPVTGEQLTKTVYRVEGDNRRGLELRHADLMRKLAALEGIEGERRLKRALFEAVESAKQSQAQVARMSKARAMADEILEREEVEHLAAAFAANRRHHIG